MMDKFRVTMDSAVEKALFVHMPEQFIWKSNRYVKLYVQAGITEQKYPNDERSSG